MGMGKNLSSLIEETLQRDDLVAFKEHVEPYWKIDRDRGRQIQLVYQANAYLICAECMMTHWITSDILNNRLPVISFIMESVARHIPSHLCLILDTLGKHFVPIREILLIKGYVLDTPRRNLADIYYSLTIGRMVYSVGSECWYTSELTAVFMFSIVPTSFEDYIISSSEVEDEICRDLLLYSGTSRDSLFKLDNGTYCCHDGGWISRHACDNQFTEEEIDELYRSAMAGWGEEFLFDDLERLKLRPSEELQEFITRAYRIIHKKRR